jgi:hypothetical protein
VLASTVAWLWPIQSPTRGFTSYSGINAFSLAAVASWYALVSSVAFVGYKLGSTVPPVRSLQRTSDTTMYVRLTILASIGVIYSWAQIVGTVDVAAVFSNSTANVLTQALPQGAGIQTLRYVSGLSAAIAFHRWVRNHYKPTWDLLYNVTLLGATAVLSSRLVLILAVLTALFLRAKDADFAGVRLRALAALGVGLFFATTALNYLRNANYYEGYGISNPFAMNGTEIAAYLGTPMQAAVGVADAVGNGLIGRGVTGELSVWGLLIPTYFVDPDSVYRPRPYMSFVDVRSNLTTNSVFADVGVDYGLAGLATALVMILAAAILVGHFQNYANYVRVAGAVALYAFAEVWRVYLFNVGILHALLVVTIVAALPVALPARRSGLLWKQGGEGSRRTEHDPREASPGFRSASRPKA